MSTRSHPGLTIRAPYWVQQHRKAYPSLNPAFKAKVDAVLNGLRARGWFPVVVEGVRTPEEQTKKVEAGVGAEKSWHVPGRTVQSFVDVPIGHGSIIDRVSAVTTGFAADIVDARWGWEGPCHDN